MNKKVKNSLYLLLVILLSWLLLQFLLNQIQIVKVKELIKQELEIKDSDIKDICTYNHQQTVAVLKPDDYFLVKDNKIKIIDLMNTTTKEKYSNMEVDKNFIDLYWILENCN